jgi:hypothetical protein
VILCDRGAAADAAPHNDAVAGYRTAMSRWLEQAVTPDGAVMSITSGMKIIALPSTAAGGTVSRIVRGALRFSRAATLGRAWRRRQMSGGTHPVRNVFM